MDARFEVVNQSPITVYDTFDALIFWDGDHPQLSDPMIYPSPMAPMLPTMKPHVPLAIRLDVHSMMDAVAMIEHATRQKLERPIV